MNLNFTEPAGSGRGFAAFLRIHPKICFAMRVSFFYTVLMIISVQLLLANSGNSQNLEEINVTIELQNGDLIKLFKKIESQSGLLFGFQPQQVESFEITIPKATRSVKATLDLALRNTNLSYRQEKNTVIIFEKSELANENPLGDRSLVPVSGKVVDKDGNPIPGVSVVVKGTARGVVTDSEGNYAIDVNEGEILVFSFIGFKKMEEEVKGRATIDLIMEEDTTTLDEVTIVSTGYQELPKERATGSFALVDNKTLNQQVGTDILQRLDGVTSGLQFVQNKTDDNRSLGIAIRGMSSINGPLDPLIVVDGFIYEGNIANINPNAVENITILKDAAAGSIWGTRAGNGVIVITTKRGGFNKKLQVDFSANVIIGSEPDLYSIPVISSRDFIGVEQTLFNSGFYDNQISFEPHRPLSPAVEAFLDRRSGEISATDSASRINALSEHDVRKDYLRHFYRKPVTQQYYVGLRGGSDNNAYTISTAYDNSLSELYARADKLNIQLQNIYKPIERLQLKLLVQYTNSTGQSGRPSYNSIGVEGRPLPYLSFTESDGSPKSIDYQYREEYTATLGGGELLDWRYYPMEEYKHSQVDNQLEEWYSVAGLQYKLFDFMSVDLQYQYQRQHSKIEEVNDTESYTARNIINLFSQIDPGTGEVSYIVPKGGVRRTSNSGVQSFTARAQLNFNHTWKQNSINGIFGYDVREALNTGDAVTTYGYNSDPLSYGNVDFVNWYPTLITGNPEAIPGAPSFSRLTNRFISFYANGAYLLSDKYAISVSARRDGANVFGATTNDKWKPLWSTGASWNLSKEKFYKSALFPQVKVRVTYGKSGNVDLRKTPLPLLDYGTDPMTNLPAALVNEVNDPSLRWEQVSMFNIGTDFSTKNEIISGSAEFYVKKASDLYAQTSYDYTTFGGQQTITKNVASMKARGVDLMLRSKNIDKVFKWSTTFLFNFYKDETTEYFTEGSKTVTTLLSGGDAILPVIGKPLYSIAAYRWGGLDASGNPQGYVDGQLSTNYDAIVKEGVDKGVNGNIVYIGPAIPTVFGSLINSFSWKGFEVNVNISYRFGYYFKNPTISYNGLIANGTGHSDFSKRWQNPGDEKNTNVPAFRYPFDFATEQGYSFYELSEIHILKGDHIRLQYVNLNYSFDGQRWSKDLFRGLQMFMNVSNLGILWRANKEKIDPDYPSTFAPGKTFAIGVRANL